MRVRERGGQHYVRDGGREREGGSVAIGVLGCVTSYILKTGFYLRFVVQPGDKN